MYKNGLTGIKKMFLIFLISEIKLKILKIFYKITIKYDLNIKLIKKMLPR